MYINSAFVELLIIYIYIYIQALSFIVSEIISINK